MCHRVIVIAGQPEEVEVALGGVVDALVHHGAGQGVVVLVVLVTCRRGLVWQGLEKEQGARSKGRRRKKNKVMLLQKLPSAGKNLV